MPEENFKTPFREFCYRLAKALAFLPILLIVISVIIYYTGPSRASRINKYNKKAQDWVNEGLSEFDGATFNITTSGSDRIFEKYHAESVGYYPCRDSCKLEGDPTEGCVYTDDLHFFYNLLVMEHDNHFIVKDNNDNVIIDKRMDVNATITRTAREIQCAHYLDRCQYICDDMGGVWDHITNRCVMTVYADRICYRVRFADGKWQLDSNNAGELPRNNYYTGMESDGVGCDYGNNWNSIHYGKSKMSNIRVELRSYRDSFLAASAYTQSCSNDYTSDHSCFGLTRREENFDAFLWIHISFGLFVLVILVYCIIRMIARYRYNKAIRESENTAGQSLVNAVV